MESVVSGVLFKKPVPYKSVKMIISLFYQCKICSNMLLMTSSVNLAMHTTPSLTGKNWICLITCSLLGKNMADIDRTSIEKAQFLVCLHGLCILYSCLNEI